MRPPGWFRLLRAAVFAAVCVALSQVAHDLMATRPAPLWAGWVALAGLGAVGYCLADRRRPAWWILLAVQVTQVCLHVWFASCTPAGPRPETAARMTMPGHAMAGHAMHAAGGGAALPHGAGISLGMLGAHALAGLLVALWLHAGERALWRALRAVAGFLLGRILVLLAWTVAPAGPRTAGRAGRCDEDEPAGDTAVLRHVLIRRGPPRAGRVLAFV